uniref:Fibronectin type-III domain-containing protein n=1 Tax=Globisporangium ultimum (strain ATCC 200006 / CBS 805.95 / DAOM BR144) TaxID=431595 RepID=K3W6S6_GLOUD
MTRLLYSTEYKLKYKAFNAVGGSESSDVLVVSTKFISLPGEPRNVTLVDRTSGSASISWKPPVDFGGTEVTSYQIAFFTGYEIRAQFTQVVSNVSENAASLTAKVSGLNATTSYGFFVVGVNDVSACVDVATFTTYAILYATTLPMSPPLVPQNLNVTVSTPGMQVVTWSPTTDGGGDPTVAYLLYSDLGILLYNGTQTQFKRGSLVPNTTYGYSVMTYNSVGASVLSPVVRRKTISGLIVPSRPLDPMYVHATGGSISLQWSRPLDSGGENLKGYRVYRGSTLLVQEHLNTAFVDDIGLIAEQEYVYTFQAENTLGVGPQSEAVVAHTTVATVPAAAANLTVLATGGRLAVAWTPPHDTGGIPLETYRVQVDTIGTETLVDLLMEDTVYEYFGIFANTLYNASVVPMNKIGNGTKAFKTVVNGKAIAPKAPLPPVIVSSDAQHAVLTLQSPVDSGGANITQLSLYQDGVHVRSVTSSGYFQVSVGPLFANKVYAFTSTAVSILELGESPQSDTTEVTTANPTPPSSVYNVIVTRRAADSLTLKWDGPDDIGGENVVYVVEYTIKANGTVATMETRLQGAVLTGLASSAAYMVRVRAENSAGDSAWTSAIQGETDVSQRGTITLRPVETTVFENSSSLTLQLIRVNGSSSNITCYYTVGNATNATADTDYVLSMEADRHFSFADGESLKEFTVQIVNDD